MDNNEIYTLVPYEEKEDENKIDIKILIAKAWCKRKFILIFTSIFILLGIFIAFAAPVSYTANCTVVPQTSSKGSGGSLGGLASMMGVNLGSSMSGETLSPYVYPQIIYSIPFCKDIMETPIIVEKSNGEPITLYQYYTDKQYSGTNILGVAKRYTIGLPRVILSTLRGNKATTVVADTITGQVIVLSKIEREIIEVIQGNIQINSNDQEGYITLGYSFSEPQPTAVIAQNVFSTLEKYVANYKSQKQLDNLHFVENSYERAREDFKEKQAALAAFQDANRDLTSAMARTTERSLLSEYEVAYTVYNELARQLEQAKIAVKESTPILTVINPVVVPNQKSAPRRPLILIAFAFLGFVIAVVWVFTKPFFQKLVLELREKKIEEI